MTVLPVVARELRIAARKRGNFWLRVAAALAGMILGSGFMALSTLRGVGAAPLGGVLFGVLTWLALAAALSAGLFFTSDCLSEEKREGTLGLLFLTDLKGYDIVLGKLAATSLNAFYGMLAIFPVMAIPLLAGGVTGAEFWRVVLVSLNNLLFSLAARHRVSDSTNGFRAIRTSVLRDPRIRLDQPWLDEYELEPYLYVRAIRLGYRTAEVPVTKVYPARRLGQTKMKPIVGWWSILRPLVFLGLGLKK